MQNQFPEKLTFEYEIIKKIGEGANGETWLAKSRITNMHVAIKCLKIGMVENLKVVELFMREAALLESIQVSGVPKFYMSISPEIDGRGFLVQEYINAPSLQNLLDSGTRFSESETLNIALKVAQILLQLQTEYQPPIIHRDLKPSNILYNSSTHDVWIIDFGSVTNPQKRTGGSTVAGTFGYMPPEQIMGNVDIQSDFYALGATMLHMLTGVMPSEMESNVYKLDFEPTLAQNAPQTRQSTKDLLTRLLDPNPANRPANASELIQQLQLAKECRPVKKLSRWESFLKFIRELFHPQRKMRSGRLSMTGKSLTNISKTPDDSSHYSETIVEIDNSLPLLTMSEIEKKNLKPYDKDGFTFITRKWVKTDGIIRRYSQVGEGEDKQKLHECLEYTFNVEDYTYWGGILADASYPIQKFPVKCTVMYNPSKPWQNALYDYEH